MQTIQQFCLRWNNHQPNFISVFTALLSDEALVDVTLACEGKFLQAHRVVLSACSAYFQTLFTVNPCKHPIVILKDIKFKDLRTMVDFMYHGEVNVSQEQLPAILKIAEMLKIKGLADLPVGAVGGDRTELRTPQQGDGWRRSASPMSPITRRKRLRKTSTGSGSGSTEQTSEEVVGDSVAKIERIESDDRSRLAHDPSTDSEPRELDAADAGSRSPSTTIRRHGSSEMRQLSHDSRQSSINDERQTGHDRHLSTQDRQASHESRLSHDSSIDSVTTDVDASPGGQNLNKERIGTKRGRLLMRQQRVKKEIDTHTSPDSEPGSPGFPRQRSESSLTKTESIGENSSSVGQHILRQRSEPGPTISPMITSITPLRNKIESPITHNLLAVPQTTYPTRQLSLGSRITQKTTHVAEEVGETSSNAVFIHDHLPIVRIIPDAGRPEPEPATPHTPQTPIGIANSGAIAATEPSRSEHCPVLRDGPALGCNYCWNSIDDRGRILRRKTKYHCPDCQSNLCIVPCFQLFHREEKHTLPASSSSSSSTGPQTLAS